MKKCTRFLIFVIAAISMFSLTSFARGFDKRVSIGAVELTEDELPKDIGLGSLMQDDGYVPDKDGYGRSVLEKSDRADVYLHVYDALDKGFKNLDTRIVVNDGFYYISFDEYHDILEAYTADHPEMFWLYHTVEGYDEGNVYYVYPVYSLYDEYYCDERVRDLVKESYGIEATNDAQGFIQMIKDDSELFLAEADAIIEDMYEKVPEGETAFETQYNYALWLHDVVCDAVDYDLDAPNHQTAYGALVDGRAVCAGYSELYQFLLHEAGIDAWSVKGDSVDPSSGSVVPHEWTLLWIDGVCVYADTTWDDQGPEIYHIYFARSFSEFSADHVPDSGFYADSLPVCNETECCKYGYFEYYDTKDKVVGGISVENVGERLTEKQQGRIWRSVLYFEEWVDVSAWLHNSENLQNLIINYLYADRYSFGVHTAGSDAVGYELHFTIIRDGDSSLYIEKKHIDGRYLLYALKDFALSSQDTMLYVVFFDESGKTVQIRTISFGGVFEEQDITLPKGCTDFKIIHLDALLKPLCSAVSSCE